MGEVEDLFSPLIGQLVWGVQVGHGSFLTLEFGAPHLWIREPISASPSVSVRVRRNLKRRMIAPTGDWYFWVQYAEWALFTSNGVVRSSDSFNTASQECFRDLDGQKLVAADFVGNTHSLTLAFDLGGRLEILPSNEIADDQWSLYAWAGNIVTCRHDGTLEITTRKAERPC